MRFLTSNSTGKEVIGGIHTHLQAHILHSPEHTFDIVELNGDRQYISEDNRNIHKLNVKELIGTESLKDLLKFSDTLDEVEESGKGIQQEYQRLLQTVSPDVVFVFGTSLASYFLLRAVQAEGGLEKTIHSYSGVIEKEIGGFSRQVSKSVLETIGRAFTREDVNGKVTYIFPSEICKNTVEDLHNVRLANANVIPNGVSSDFLSWVERRRPPRKITLGYVGRVSPVKNPDYFLTINQLLQKPVSLKMLTDIYAASESASGKSLLKQMTEGSVAYCNPRPPRELADFYRREVSAIVIPSHFETFCNVAPEAIVTGTPVLLSDKAGSSEVFQRYADLKDLVFSIDDPESFRRSFDYARRMKFIVDPKTSRKMYYELRWENIIEKYNKIAESICTASSLR